MVSVRLMNGDTARLYNRIDNRYLAAEQVRVLAGSRGFSLEYTPLEQPQWRAYPPDDRYTPEELLKRNDAACLFAWMDEQPAGQAVVLTHWNHLAMLWDIRVDVPYRNRGVGRALLGACASWARERKLKGLVAETQDANPAACRFYQRSGFILGGADRMLYAAIPRQEGHPPIRRDSALFFYLLFD